VVARFLTAGLWSLLDNSRKPQERSVGGDDRPEKYFEAFQEHPLVRQLGQAVSNAGDATGMRKRWQGLCGWFGRRFRAEPLKDAVKPIPGGGPRRYEKGRLRPSYLPPAIFATVVTSFLLDEKNSLPTVVGEASPPEPDETEKEEAQRRRAEGSPLEKSLQALVDEAAGNAVRLRANLEGWYDAQMERVSGWYKRESKRLMLFLAVLVVVAMNVDSIAITRTMWSNCMGSTVRSDRCSVNAAQHGG